MLSVIDMELVTAFTAAAVALVVAVLTPSVSGLRQRRDAINAKFDDAVAAILRVQASRHIATSIERRYHPGSDEQYKAFIQTMAEDSITRFVDETVAARAALADIAAYVPEAGDWIQSGWELRQDRATGQRQAIEARRTPALRSLRLFRSRRPIRTDT